jgi:hypothetical protein
MDTSKMSRYDWVVVAGALVYFFALFLPWFRLAIPQDVLDALAKGLHVNGADVTGLSQNGWRYGAAVIAWLFTLLAAALVVVKGLRDLKFTLPLPEGMVVMALGTVALVLVLLRLIFVPAAAFHRAGGIWVALLAAAAVALGGFLKNAETS